MKVQSRSLQCCDSTAVTPRLICIALQVTSARQRCATVAPHAGSKDTVHGPPEVQATTCTKPHAGYSRRAAVALAAATVTGLGLKQPQAACGKPALLDLPACDQFAGAGAIKYCEIQQGSGDSPLAGDLIVVDYTARAVATREVYDGSRNFKFTVGNGEVIPGWEQGILGNDYIPAIREGGSRTLLIPPQLAYGTEGDGCLFGLPDSCRIPPNSEVIITFKYRGLGYYG